MTTSETSRIRKPAEARYPIRELISERWSPRAFDSRTVEGEKLASLFEAARWAPSSGNKQPWFFIIATQEDADVSSADGPDLMRRQYSMDTS